MYKSSKLAMILPMTLGPAIICAVIYFGCGALDDGDPEVYLVKECIL